MKEAQARAILGNAIRGDQHLRCADGLVIKWRPGTSTVILEGRFRPEELEALAWWMRQHAETTAGETPDV